MKAADCGGGSCSCGCSGTACGGCDDNISFSPVLQNIPVNSNVIAGIYADRKERPRLVRV